MENPLVSVIIPVYGVEKYIERCAHSLFGQTMREGIEYIFVDDCSPDRSVEILMRILEEYPHRQEQVKIIRHKVNQGVGGTRRSGVENATGEYIIHCDSDDWVEPDMYETLYKEAKDTDADLVGCDFQFGYATQGIVEQTPFPSDPIQYMVDILTYPSNSVIWNKMIKASVYAAAFESGCELFVKGVNVAEDMLAVTQLVYYCHKIAYVPCAMYHYRQTNPGSYTHVRTRSSIENQMEVIKRLEQFFLTNKLELSCELGYQKAKVKCRALYSGALIGVPSKERKKWAKLYPEINNKILFYPRRVIHPYWRIALFFASFGFLFLFDVMMKIYLTFLPIRTMLKTRNAG